MKLPSQNRIFKSSFYWTACLILSLLLILALHDRIKHTYLEDDMLWFLPSLSQLIEHKSLSGSMLAFHQGELTFSDGVYFSILLSVFGLQLKYYVWASLAIHFLNAIFLFLLLKNRLKFSFDASFWASLLYLGFYGHFHAYTWPLAAHHLLVVFFILLITFFYLKTEEFFERNSDDKKYYWITLSLSFVASFLRLSILVVPVMILVHLLFTTKDKEKVLAKYDRWLPLFGIFMVYQLLVLSSGSPGDILSDVVKPFHEILGEKRSFLKGLVVVTVFMGGLWMVRFFLARILARRTSNIFMPIVGWGALLILLIPQKLFLCLYAFVNAFRSASFDRAWERGQVMVFPEQGPLTVVGMGLLVIMILFFLHHMVTKNKALIVFVAWYLALFPYLSRYTEGVPSRYLLYLSVFFCVMLSLFLMEILPNFFPQRWGTICRRGACLVIFSFLAVNVLSIKTRLLRTALTDYHWSYDYIKIAHLIKEDLSKDPTKAHWPVCVVGLKDIPYAQNWKKSFLKEFDFSRYDPFSQTFLAAGLGQEREIIVNGVCPNPSLIYRVDGVTVRDQNGRSLELFYQSFEEGLERLRRSDDAEAAVLLEEALKAKPFLMNFVRGPSKGTANFYKEGVSAALSETIYQRYASFYDGDPKMEYINNMIQTEAEDYGKALALLADLKGKAEDLQGTRLAATGRRPLNLGQAVEIYHGFKIIFFHDFYFAWEKEAGDFNLARFRREKGLNHLVSRTKHELRREIDQVLSRSPAGIPALGNEPDEEAVYKNFRISRINDVYFCLSDEEGRFTPQNENHPSYKTLFTSRSLKEAQLVIDHFLEIEDPRSQNVERLIKICQRRYPQDQLRGEFLYVPSMMNVPLGEFTWELGDSLHQDPPALEGRLRVRPFKVFRKISSDTIGWDFASVFREGSFLPFVFEETNLLAKRRGKSAKRTEYHHDALWMDRQGQKDDIEDDTRDPVTFLAWLMSRDYDHLELVKSTLNINRRLYTVVGKVTQRRLLTLDGKPTQLVKLKLKILGRDPQYRLTSQLPVEIYLLQKGKMYLPILADIKTAWGKVKIALSHHNTGRNVKALLKTKKDIPRLTKIR